MPASTDFSYPKDEYVTQLHNLYAELNGQDSFQPVKDWQSEKWSSTVYCSRGRLLEKAGFSQLHIADGSIEGTNASLSFMETIAYPANPKTPGYIIMTNMNERKELGKTIVFYSDLIIQNGVLQPGDSELFSSSLGKVCQKHNYDFDALNRFGAGQGLMGGTAGECGFLYFFKLKDAPFLDEIIQAVLSSFRKIVLQHKDEQAVEDDYRQMYRSRARLIEWIIAEDYGIKIARENGVPMEFIEAYAFPPVVTY